MFSKSLFSWSLFILIVLLCFFLFTDGCDKDNPVAVDSAFLEADLLPLAEGRLWVFTAYELDTTASQKIPSSVHREVTYVVGTTTFKGKSAFQTVDSTYTPAGVPSYAETSYIAIENGDMYQWNEEFNAWFGMVQKSAGLNSEYLIVEAEEEHDGVTIKIEFKGMILPEEAVAAPIGTVQAYKLKIWVTVSYNGIQYDTFETYMYLADGYGPVKMYTPVQIDMDTGIKANGEESLLVSKNF